MKLYLDIFFLLNMGINFVIFMTESFFIRGCVRIPRLLGASAAGAASACLMVVTGVHRFLPLLMLPKLQRTQLKISRYYRIRLHYAGARIEGNALLDTGNGLYDPISHQPVLLGDAGFLNTLLKKEEEPVMRIIPFHSVGKETGLLRAFQAESLEIASGDGWRCIDKPWVAICDKYVSADGEYEIILHPEMLIEDKN